MINKTKAKSIEKLKFDTLNKKNDQKDSSLYRGIFYNDTSEKEFYEFGAHFSYKELYNQLSLLQNIQTKQAQKDLLTKMTTNTKEILKKNIKLKITRNKSKPTTRKTLSTNKNLSTINVINNNNINLTNLNVNLNLNFNNNDNNNSNIILEKLNQIEQTVLNNAKMSSFLSRNNKTSNYQQNNVCSNNNHHNVNQNKDYNSYFNNKDNYRNLTLYNAIKNLNYDHKGILRKVNKNLVNSVRGMSQEKPEEKKRSISSKVKARFSNVLKSDN